MRNNIESGNEKKRTLKDLNNMLFNQLDKLCQLDTSDTQNAKMEIARSNAISQTSKAILQSVGIELMAINSQQVLSKNVKQLISVEE